METIFRKVYTKDRLPEKEGGYIAILKDDAITSVTTMHTLTYMKWDNKEWRKKEWEDLIDYWLEEFELPDEEEIKDYVWEEIDLPLSQRDIDNNSDNYKTYLTVIDWTNWLLNKIKG